MPTSNSAHFRTWPIAAAVALAILFWFLWPQLGVIALTVLMAYIFYPLYARLKRKRGNAAAITTLLLSFLVVIIPIAFVIVASIGQLARLAEVASQSEYWADTVGLLDGVVDLANDLAEPITGVRPSLTEEGMVKFLQASVVGIARVGLQLLTGIATSLPQFGIALIIYIFLFVELLKRGPELVRKIEELSPFDPSDTRRYLERTGLMANAMVKGQLIIAMVIAAISAALLIPLGYGHFFFLFFIIFTILNFIPLGSGIVVVPLVLYAMAMGQFWLGIVVIVLYYVAGNLDPLLRAKLIPKQIQMSVAVTMIATFCGIAYFGILGVVYGPIIMIILTTTFGIYGERRQTKTQKQRNTASKN